MPVDSQTESSGNTNREMERTPYSQPETLRVRCPHCRKLYLVQYGDIQEAKPRFECVQCRSRFFLSLNEADLNGEVFGLPVDSKDVPPVAAKPAVAPIKPSPPLEIPDRDLSPCPKCFKLNEAGVKECGHCGVIIKKFTHTFSIQENFPPHSATLEAAWHKVMADYGDDDMHDEFLLMCQREENLAYAAALYMQMSKLMPADELTTRRLTAIQKMGEMLIPPTRASVEYRAPRRMPRVWQLPLFAGTLLILVGMSSPVFRNMAGVGGAFVFFALALHIQLRRR